MLFKSLLVFAVCCASALSQEGPPAPSAPAPIKFRGAYVGEALSDFVDCSSAKQKLLVDGYKLRGKVCEGKTGVIYRTKLHGFLNVKGEGEQFRFEDRKLVRITIDFANDDFEKAKYDLTEKFGPPLSQVPDIYQNGFGARWEFNRGFWRKGDLVAFAQYEVDSVGACHVLSVQRRDDPCISGIRVVVTSADRAGEPDTKPNSLD